MTVQFTIGADPEIFVKKNGKAISAHGLVQGNKKSPFKTEMGAYQVDGMALEFNIDPTPIRDFEGFNKKIVHTMGVLREAAGDVNFAIVPVQEFDKDYFEAQPDEAKELGCDPDWNAYEMKPNEPPERPTEGNPFSTGAGHLHFGWGADIPVDNEDHIEICADFVKVLDFTIGMFMTIIDQDPRRRLLYGKAGCFRPKPYGVEYRTPSNVWLTNKTRRQAIHILANAAIYIHSNGYSKAYINSAEIRRIIDEGDVKAAVKQMENVYRFVDFTKKNVVKAAINGALEKPKAKEA